MYVEETISNMKNILTLLRRNYFGLWDWQALKDMQRGGL